MRLSTERIKALQALLKEQFGLMYTDEEAQRVGLAVMRLVLAKHRQANQPTKSEEKDNGRRNKEKPDLHIS